MICLLIRVICGESPKVNQRHWTKVGHRQLVHPPTQLITSVERNCLHGSLWLIQPCWSTWGTHVNAPLVFSTVTLVSSTLRHHTVIYFTLNFLVYQVGVLWRISPQNLCTNFLPLPYEPNTVILNVTFQQHYWTLQNMHYLEISSFRRGLSLREVIGLLECCAA